MSEEQINPLDMSTEEFEKLSLGQDDSLFGSSSSSEEEDTLFSDDTSEDHVEEEIAEEEEFESDESEEFDDHDDDYVINYEEEYSKVIGQEIDLGGTKFTLSSMDEVKQLLENSAKTLSEAESMKQSKGLVDALKAYGIDDPKQLAFAADLIKKDPRAIASLIKDMDLMEIMDNEEEYVPQVHTPNRMDEVLQSISNTPTYSRTIQVVGNEWDAKSLETFRTNPDMLITLNTHMANGVFDTVTAEIKKQRMLGTIPPHIPDYEVYDTIGQMIYSQPQQAQQEIVPPKRVSTEQRIRQKKGMSSTRSSPSKSTNIPNALEMSTQEFEAYMNKHPELFR